jgi:hypothetical protein
VSLRPSLRRHLREHLAEHFGESRAIAQLRSRPCPYTSSFRLDELTVGFADGSTQRLMLKDLSGDAMLADARRARPPFMNRPLRELNAYRWILPFAPPGTPKCFATEVNREGDRYWLFLERVAGSQLSLVGEFASWERTAAWIAAFHRTFGPDQAERLARRAGLLVYDADFFWLWLRRAQRFAEHEPAHRRALAEIAQRYDRVVARLVRLPQTLIHGELYPCNVIVGAKSSGPRICPVDWEMSALGPGLVDLAALSAGWAEESQLALARAYLAPNAPSGAAPPRLSSEFLVDLDCCRLHLAVRMLGWSDQWAPPRQHACDWLAEAVRISDRLRQLTPSAVKSRGKTFLAAKTSSATLRAARA